MFGIGMPELIVILVVALVVLGPQRLPELARTLGKAMAEFRRQTSDVFEEFQAHIEEEPARRTATRPNAAPEGTQTASAPQAVPPPTTPPPKSDTGSA